MKLKNLGLKEDFMNLTSKAREVKAKINNWDYIKLKSSAKEIINKVKKQPSKWETIFASNTSDKGLISKIYEKHTTLTTANKWSNQKMGRGSEQTLLPRGHTNGQQIFEKVLNIIAIREMQIKATMRYHLTPVRIAIINRTSNNKCWRGCREKGTLIHCWWIVHCTATVESGM